jgi:serine/threonine protein kinase
VCRAEDLALGREVALKFLAPECSTDYGRIARFQHEARTVASLNHSNICTIYEIGDQDGRHFIAMELLDGQPLSHMIGTRPLATYALIELAIQIADALDAAHAEGIVHRDLKPANIFITRRDQVKLLDFGLAVLIPRSSQRVQTPPMPPLGLTGGTIPYMSPEQVQGNDLDPRTDIFSLGIVIYEMATGRRPFVGSTAREMMDAILNEMPVAARELNPSVPPDLGRIIDRALEKNRKLRYQTASDLRADLQRLKRDLDSTSVRTRVPATAARTPTRLRRFRRIAAGVGSITTLSVAGLAFVAVRNGLTPPPVHEPLAIRTVNADYFLGSPRAAASKRAAPDTVAITPRSTRSVEPEARGVSETPPAAQPAQPVQPDVKPAPAGDRLGDDLRVARQKIDLRLYDQALETLHRVADAGSADEAVEASFLIASIHERRGNPEDAMSTYLEAATRYPDDARAPEAIYQMAESMLKSKRKDRDVEARRMLTKLADRYPVSSWAPLALMARAEIEARLNLYQLDERLGASVPAALVTYRQVADGYKTSPSAALAAWKLAHAYIAAKRFDLAAATFERLGAEDGEHRDAAWLAAGELYEKRLNDSARAQTAYAQVRPSSPIYRDAQKRLRK